MIGNVTPSVLGAHMWAKWLHDPYYLGVSKAMTKSQVVASPLLS